MTRVPLKKLVMIFFRVGNLTFGGGNPTMAALQTELVASRKWLDEEQYALIYALARITPGTNLLAFSAGAAWRTRGLKAAVLAVVAMAVPSSAAVVLLTQGYRSWHQNVLAMAAIAGTLAAAVGMMVLSAWQLLAPQLVRGRRLFAAVIFLSALAASLHFSMSPVAVLGLAALAGLIWRAPVQV